MSAQSQSAYTVHQPQWPAPWTAEDTEQTTLRRLADYARLSGIIWIVLGIIQICSLVLAIAGIWNVVAGITRLSCAKRIRARDPGVPQEFDGVAGLIIIGAINLIFGAVIGVVFVGVDFFVRDHVLKNRHLFREVAPAPGSG